MTGAEGGPGPIHGEGGSDPDGGERSRTPRRFDRTEWLRAALVAANGGRACGTVARHLADRASASGHVAADPSGVSAACCLPVTATLTALAALAAAGLVGTGRTGLVLVLPGGWVS